MRTRSESSTVLLVLVLVLTFPFWITAGAVLFGVVAGLLGAAIGVLAALAGAVIALIALPFKLLFGHGHWGLFNFHHHGIMYLVIAVLIIAALIRGRNQRPS